MALTSPDHDEKRGFFRMSVECKVVYKEVDSSDDNQGTTINLSGTGVLFQSDAPMKVGQRLKVSVLPEKNIIPPLDATARVVRVSPTDSGGYEVAVEFEQIS